MSRMRYITAMQFYPCPCSICVPPFAVLNHYHHTMNTAPPNTLTTALSICNLALAKLGESPISAISPVGSLAARLCYSHYHPVRRELLCSNRWSFATKLTQIQGDANSPGTPAQQQSHPLPDDCLRVLEVNSPNWTLRGRSIYCTEDTIELLYLADVEDPLLFEPLFIEAFATRLACKLCIPLTSSTTAREALTQEYHRLALPQAAHINAIQSHSNDTHPLLKLWRKSYSQHPNCE